MSGRVSYAEVNAAFLQPAVSAAPAPVHRGNPNATIFCARSS
jgi:hypothetical protein